MSKSPDVESIAADSGVRQVGEGGGAQGKRLLAKRTCTGCFPALLVP